MTERVLVTGATGFIGGRLAARLGKLGTGGAMPGARPRPDSRPRARARRASTCTRETCCAQKRCAAPGDGVDVAYYLIHSMGRGGAEDFAASERAAPRRSPGWRARRGSSGSSTSAASVTARSPSTCAAAHETALALAEHGPPLTYFRAGMVVGAQSESYRTLRYLVQRLPAMIAPAWLKNATQPIAIDDALAYLVQAPSVEALDGREIQIGGPDVLTYGEMLDRMADVARHPPPARGSPCR